MRKFLTPAQEATDDTPPAPAANAVFLGGTANGSSWRDKLIPLLQVPYFNPIVENWTIDDRAREDQAKQAAELLLYVFTPRQQGFYAIVEAVVDALRSNKKVVITFLDDGEGLKWDSHQVDSLAAIENLLQQPGNGEASFMHSLEGAASFINDYFKLEYSKRREAA